MPRDLFLGGQDSNQPQAAKASCGGVLPGYTKDVMNYATPYGPVNIKDTPGVGIHGVNSGIANAPKKVQSGGKVGLGGNNYGCGGSQGKY